MIFLLLLFSIETLIASWDLNYFFMFAIVYNLIVYPFSKYLTYSNTKDIDPLLNFLQQYCSSYFLELFKIAKNQVRIQRKESDYLKRKIEKTRK